ncbi:MAG: polysaccharide biosynthesis C-terminal domain-containing protein, partial [candidate division Zixibacteria bacterium]
NLFAFAFLGRNRIIAFNLFETGQRLIFVLLAIGMLWVVGGNMAGYMIWTLVAVAALVAVYIVYYFRTSASGPLYDASLIGPSFTYGAKSFIGTLFSVAVMRSALLFVNHYHGNYEAGLYSVAQQVSELLVIVPSVVGTILFGRVAAEGGGELTAKVLRVAVLVFLPLSLLMILFADQLVGIFGVEFLGAATALKILIPGALLLGLQVILVNDIAGRGYPWPAALVWIPVLILNVIGFLFLIPPFGINGAAMTVTGSFAAIFLFMAGYYRRISKVPLGECFVPRLADLQTLLAFASSPLGRKSRDDQARKQEHDAPVCR